MERQPSGGRDASGVASFQVLFDPPPCGAPRPPIRDLDHAKVAERQEELGLPLDLSNVIAPALSCYLAVSLRVWCRPSRCEASEDAGSGGGGHVEPRMLRTVGPPSTVLIELARKELL